MAHGDGIAKDRIVKNYYVDFSARGCPPIYSVAATIVLPAGTFVKSASKNAEATRTIEIAL
jgi:hypothetical protein